MSASEWIETEQVLGWLQKLDRRQWPVVLQVVARLEERLRAELPVSMCGDVFILGNSGLDLSGRQRMRSLIEAFLHAPDWRLSRDQLVHRYFTMPRSVTISDRQLRSQRECAVKMVSRLRCLLMTAFPYQESLPIDWLPYDKDNTTWVLCRWLTSGPKRSSRRNAPRCE